MDHKVDRAIVRAFFHISFLVDGHGNSSAPVLGPLFAPPRLITQLPQLLGSYAVEIIITFCVNLLRFGKCYVLRSYKANAQCPCSTRTQSDV